MQLMRMLVLAGLAAVAAMSSCVQAPAQGAGDSTRGRALAERLCATCHLGDNHSDKVGASGVPAFTVVARRPGQTHDGIVSWLRSVPPMMPNHHLTRDEMDDLAAFIMTLAVPGG